MKKTEILFYTLLISFINNSAFAQFCFENKTQNYFSISQGGSAPTAGAVGDINSDGIVDFVAGTSNSSIGSLLIYFGNGSNGGYNYSTTYTTGKSVMDIELADLNNDSFKDIIFADEANNNITILLGIGSGSFSAATSYSVGTFPRSIAVEDFDTDGKLDLAIVNRGSNNISVLMGTGSGSFGAQATFSVGNTPYEIKSGDFTNDGIIDLSICNNGSNNISILTGNGFGSFTSVGTFSVSAAPNGIEVSDVNLDGNMDVMTSSSTSKNFSLLLGTGTGSFGVTSNFTTSQLPRFITCADFDHDNIPDVIVGSFNCEISYFKGNGTGVFSQPNIYFLNFQTKNGLGLNYDMNNDGNLDLFLIDNTNSTANNITILMGNGLGNFAHATNYKSSPSTQYSSLLNDFNNDNVLDIAVVSSNGFSVLKGHNDGSFENESIISSSSLYGVTSADFNGDGNIDIASTSPSSNTVSIFFGQGNLTFSAPINFISGTSQECIKSGDLNGDNKIDIVTSSSSNGNISIFLGDGLGGFSAAGTYSMFPNPNYVIIKDFNNDGINDLACTCGTNTTHRVAVFYGNGSGSFSGPTYFNLNAFFPAHIISEDLNSDGYNDIITVNNGTTISNTIGNISVLLGNGSGGFLNAAVYQIGPYATSIVAKDFNNDGFIDIACSRQVVGNGLFSIVKGNGAGGFSNYISFGGYSSSVMSTGILAADFNSDSKMDIAVSAYGYNIFTNRTAGLSYSLPLTFCSSASKVLTTQPSIGYQWYKNNSIISGATAINYTATISGWYKVKTNTITGGVCLSDSVNLIAVPNMSITGTNSICSTSNASLSVTGANTYSWSNGATTSSIVVSPTVTTTYSVVGTATNSCVGSLSVSVLVIPSPTLAVNSGSICSGQSFTMIPSGATTYSYSGGSAVVSPTASIVYTITGSSGGTCVDTETLLVTVNAMPTLTIAATSSICLGSSTTLTVTNGGIVSFLWSNGSTLPVTNVVPLTTSVYTINTVDINGCANSQTVSVTVDNTCADVWPGDANSDGTADNIDVLELGLHYTQTGAPRATTSNSWQSYFANNWTGTITNGKNLNHSDCNGDGTIDDNDTLAIYNNYGSAHTFKPVQTTTVNPQLSIVPDQVMVIKGMWGTASVYLGDVTSPITNINGLAFTVDFDHTMIEPNSIYIEYQNSFIDAGQNLHFQKPDFSNGKLYTATTHTFSTNVSGYGKIGTLHYQILSTLGTDEVLTLGLSHANQSDASGTIVPLTSNTGTLMAIGASVGVKEILMNGNVLVSPNPTNGILNITLNTVPQNTKIEVYNMVGALVFSETLITKNSTINIADLSTGMYFIKVIENSKVITVKKIVKE
ncbi:MAG: FG-GAP-like repeat-containing protein [Bacteroidota bacterium]